MRMYNELDVLGFIEAKLTRGEELQLEYREAVGYKSDAYLPFGCRKLSISSDTFIEIKYNLPSSTFETLVTISKNLQKKICVILINDPVSRDIYKSRYKYISFKSFQSWIQKDVVPRPGYSIYKKSQKEYHDRIYEQACDSVRINKTTLFVGAGLGSSLFLPDWKGLVSKFYSDKDIKVPERDIDEVCQDSQLIKARFIAGDFDSSDVDIIKKELYPKGFQSKNTELLKSISAVVRKSFNDKGGYYRIESIITYNYDDYIEQSLKRHKVKCTSIYKGIRAGDSLPVYHVHGFVASGPSNSSSKSKEIVLTEQQYHNVYNRLFSWVNIEQYHALSRNTCVFVGMSMTDPNLRRLLDAVLSEAAGDDAFVIMSKLPYFPTLDKQYVFTSNMADMGVHVIWAEDYDDVPLKLRKMFGL